MTAKLGYLCSSTSWGGLEMNHLRNALWMQGRGHDVVFICVEGSRLHREVLNNKLEVMIIEKHKKYYDYTKGKQLASFLELQSITHLIIRSTYDLSIAAIVKRIMGSRVHTSYFMEMQLGVKKTNLLHTLRFKFIDLWACPLPWLKVQVETMTRYKNKIAVIPSGIELENFNNLPESNTAREILDLPKEALIFGLIGRFDPQKGQLLLLNAMAKSRNKDFHIVLLGEPTMNEGDEYFSTMKQFIQEHQLEDRVHLRPFMNSVGSFYRSVDWFVMATKAETVGMVTIESLASGTPILGSNAGGTPELLEDQTGGLLFESQNSDDLAKKINQICEQRISFDGEKLKKIAQKYDHNEVCRIVEDTLGLSAK